MKTLKEFKDACWKGYTAVGMKMKNGRKVPNCVPEEVELDEMQGDDYNQGGWNHDPYDYNKGKWSRANTLKNKEWQKVSKQIATRLADKLIDRKKARKVNEEVEQIDELSKDTLASYNRKAWDDRQAIGHKMPDLAKKSTLYRGKNYTKDERDAAEKAHNQAQKLSHKYGQRTKGIETSERKWMAKEEVTLDEMSKLSDALAKIKHDFENPPADHKDAKPAPAKKPEPKKGGGMPYYPDSHGGRRYMGDSVEMDGEMISEGPFKGVGKFMMKRKLKKGMGSDMEKAGDAYFSGDHDGVDKFMGHMANRRRKEKAIKRLGGKVEEQSSPKGGRRYMGDSVEMDGETISETGHMMAAAAVAGRQNDIIKRTPEEEKKHAERQAEKALHKPGKNAAKSRKYWVKKVNKLHGIPEEVEQIDESNEENAKAKVREMHSQILKKGYKYIGSEQRSVGKDDSLVTHNYLSKDSSHIHHMQYSPYTMTGKGGPHIMHKKTKFNTKLHNHLTEQCFNYFGDAEQIDEISTDLANKYMSKASSSMNPKRFSGYKRAFAKVSPRAKDLVKVPATKA